MKQFNLILICAFCFIFSNSWATTWDEPWQDQVIKEADHFVFAKILSSDEHKGISIEIVKSIAGKELKGKINITDFYLLYLCSNTEGHGPEFNFEEIKECYFFIKKNKNGKYCIATPSAGFAVVEDGNVYSTYRHSYHQGLTPVDIYEKTMQAIFNNYHHKEYDKKFISEYVNKYISLDPAGFDESQIKTFFAQHVAMECIYHLKLTEYFANLIPFLSDTSNFHNQVSAARALGSYNSPQAKTELLKVISDSTRGNFVKVICIWTLASFIPKELKTELTNLMENASDKDNGFGGNIMDPRVCTHFPSVRTALEDLILKL